jgi:hypothetical protein
LIQNSKSQCSFQRFYPKYTLYILANTSTNKPWKQDKNQLFIVFYDVNCAQFLLQHGLEKFFEAIIPADIDIDCISGLEIQTI